MKAVVIGGKGHIGTYLCPMLVKNGFEVVSITRGNSQPYEDDYAWKDVESVFLDRNKCSNFEEQVISMNPDIIIDLVNFNIEDTKNGRSYSKIKCLTLFILFILLGLWDGRNITI